MSLKARILTGLALLATLAGMTWLLLLIGFSVDAHERRPRPVCTYTCDFPTNCPASEVCVLLVPRPDGTLDLSLENLSRLRKEKLDAGSR